MMQCRIEDFQNNERATEITATLLTTNGVAVGKCSKGNDLRSRAMTTAIALL